MRRLPACFLSTPGPRFVLTYAETSSGMPDARSVEPYNSAEEFLPYPSSGMISRDRNSRFHQSKRVSAAIVTGFARIKYIDMFVDTTTVTKRDALRPPPRPGPHSGRLLRRRGLRVPRLVGYQVLGPDMLAAIADSPSLARTHLADAIAFASSAGIPLEIIATAEFDRPEYVRNDGCRCFHCKGRAFHRDGRVSRHTRIQLHCLRR